MGKTGFEGSENFPVTANDVYGMVETLAVQNLEGLKSTNSMREALYDYPVENGMVIEESIIKMAEAQAFNKDGHTFAPHDPTVATRYFNNFDAVQFGTTVRRNDIRKVIANKGIGVEDVVSAILESLSQGDGHDDFVKSRNALYNADFKNYREIIGGVPVNMKGVLYALRDMYNHVISDNADLTEHEYVSGAPERDVIIALSPKIMNLIDVKELASIFNLSKEEILGKIVRVDVDDLTDSIFDYFVYVYDKKALGRATRLMEYSQDMIGEGLYTNHFLTVERAYFHNPLFKGCYLDCSEACADEKATIISTPSTYSVTKTLTHATTTDTRVTVYLNESYTADFVAGDGYKFDDDSTITVTVGGEAVDESAVIISAQKVTVDIRHVTGNLAITLSPTLIPSVKGK